MQEERRAVADDRSVSQVLADVISNLQDTNNGRYVATIKSTQTGPATVTGVVEGAKIPQDLVVTFVAP